MQILDQAVQAIQKLASKEQVNGAQLAASMEAIAACGDQAVRIWQGYLDKPGEPGDKYTLMSWVGAERAKQLHLLSLQAHALVNVVCAAAGGKSRFLVLDESPVALAYGGLKENETGQQAAQTLLAKQQATNKHLRELADQLRAIKSAAPKSSGKAKNNTVRIKPAAGKAKKKPVPKKKSVTRKAVGKKSVKKAAKKK